MLCDHLCCHTSCKRERYLRHSASPHLKPMRPDKHSTRRGAQIGSLGVSSPKMAPPAPEGPMERTLAKAPLLAPSGVEVLNPNLKPPCARWKGETDPWQT